MVRVMKFSSSSAFILLHGVIVHALGSEAPVNPNAITLEATTADFTAKADGMCQTDDYNDRRGNIDCVLGDWEVERPCDATLPVQKFTRKVIVEPKYNGKPCETMVKIEECRPVHCLMSPWTDWSGCLLNGTKFRTRTVIRQPLYGGRECPHARDEVKCCEKDCRVSEWSDWVCDPTTGRKCQQRIIEREPELDGEKCPVLAQFDVCDPVDCKLSDKYEDKWSDCDPMTGTKRKYPRVEQKALYKGKPCDLEANIQTAKCPVNCVHYNPGEQTNSTATFGECTKKPGSNKWYKQRKLIVKTPALNGGQCEDEYESKLCPPKNCVSKTKANDSGAYGQCKKANDGKWYQTRKRAVDTPAENGGDACEEVVDSRVCEPVPCEQYGVTENLQHDPFKPYGTYVMRVMKRSGVKKEALYGGECMDQTRRCTLKEFFDAAMKDNTLTNKYVTKSTEIDIGTSLKNTINFYFTTSSISAYVGTKSSNAISIGPLTSYSDDAIVFTGDACTEGSGQRKVTVAVTCSENGWDFNATAIPVQGKPCEWTTSMQLPGPCSPSKTSQDLSTAAGDSGGLSLKPVALHAYQLLVVLLVLSLFV